MQFSWFHPYINMIKGALLFNMTCNSVEFGQKKLLNYSYCSFLFITSFAPLLNTSYMTTGSYQHLNAGLLFW